MIAYLIREYCIKSVKDLFGNTVQSMLEAEFDLYMGALKTTEIIRNWTNFWGQLQGEKKIKNELFAA